MRADLLQRAVTGCTAEMAQKLELPLSLAMAQDGITHPLDMAHFLAQIGHETGGFKWLRELWGPTAQQKRYERDFSQPWNSKNQRNKLSFNLGNAAAGDGSRFRGRGLIQTTGRTNYRILTNRLKAKLEQGTCRMPVPDFEETPELLQEPMWAAYSATDYWLRNGITALAMRDDIEAVTRKVNGGLNGIGDRRARLNVARRVLMT